MGNFSFISKNYDQAVLNPWHEKTLCELQLVIDGVVIEKMRGIYSGYGAVLTDEPFIHLVFKDNKWVDITATTKKKAKKQSHDGEMWVSFDWDTINNIHCDTHNKNGLAIWHVLKMDQDINHAVSQSDFDDHMGDRPVEDEYDEDPEDDRY